MIKNYREGDPIPKDFWNYNINIILGYKYQPETRDYHKETEKYGLSNNQVR